MTRPCHHDATHRHSVLAGDCHGQCCRPSTRDGMSHLCDSTVPVRQCGETMHWQPHANTPLFYFARPPENVCGPQIVDFFFGFAWGFCIENCRGCLVNFFWSPFPTKRNTKTPQKFREKFGANSGQNSGQKFKQKSGNFRSATFLT